MKTQPQPVKVKTPTSQCPFCKAGFEKGEPQSICASCLARHHQSCWKQHGRCAVFGCDSTAYLPSDAATHTGQLVPTSKLPLARPAGAPIPVDLGPAPRDIDGPFGDVYRQLVPGLIVSGVQNPFALLAIWLLVITLVVCTAGILLFVAWGVHAHNKKKYLPLFQGGERADGRVIGVTSQNDGSATIQYEFEARAQRWRALYTRVDKTLRNFAIGDPVSVLYDAADPNKSCIVYRVVDS